MAASSSDRSVPRGSIAVHVVRQVLSLPEIQIEFLGVEAPVFMDGRTGTAIFLGGLGARCTGLHSSV